MAAHSQSIRTNLVKAKIDKSQGDSLSRMDRKVDESMDHIGSGCRKLAQKDYKRRHDNLGKIVHWKLARKCTFEAGDKWYEHEPESVKIWNVKVKIIPLVVGSLGTIPNQFGNRLKQIGIIAVAARVQKTVLLGTARILRKVEI